MCAWKGSCMWDLALTVYPVLLLALLFYGAKLYGRGELSPSFLCVSETRQIEAFAALGVILHHLTQRITGYGAVWRGPVSIFADIGFLFTALFFFFSGYGLMMSLQEKPDYLRTIPGRRLPTVLIPFWVTNLLVVFVLQFGFGVHMSALEAFKYVTGLTLINGNGWFIVEITILYLLFYMCFLLIRRRDAALVILSCAVMLLIAVSFFRGHDEGKKISWFRGEWWYNSTLTFLFGLWYARMKTRIDRVITRRHTFLTVLFCVLTVLSVSAARTAIRRYGYYTGGLIGRRYAAMTYAAQTAACFFAAGLTVLLNMRIRVGNRVLTFVAGIRMELFLIHSFFADLIFGVRMPVFARYAAVLASGIACAALLAPPIRRLTLLVSGFLAQKREVRDTLEARLREEKRRKRIRRTLAAACLALLAAAGYILGPAVMRYLLAESEYISEMEAIRTSGIGQRVLFGRFEQDRIRPGDERVGWIVIAREGDKVCLLAEKGLCGSVYNRKHAAVTWEDSDIRALLHSGVFAGMFSRYERESIAIRDGDVLTLLTPEEADSAFASDKARELAVTSAAEAGGTNVNRMSKHHNWDMKGYRSSWWWLKGERGRAEITAPIVTVDGTIERNAKAVNKPGGAVRPAVWVKTG